jgi:hypothetical protein
VTEGASCRGESLSPEVLAMQIYEACVESGVAAADASLRTIEFLTAAIGFAISAATSADDQLRIKTQRAVADMIAQMPRHPATWTPTLPRPEDAS